MPACRQARPAAISTPRLMGRRLTFDLPSKVGYLTAMERIRRLTNDKRLTRPIKFMENLAIVGLALGSTYYIVDHSIRDLLKDAPYSRPKPNDLNKIDEPISIDNLPFYQEQFSDKISQLNSAFYEVARRPNNSKAIVLFEQIALDHLIEGLQTLNSISPDSIEYLKSPKKEILARIDGVIFDLNDRLQFQEAASLTYLKLENTVIKQSIESGTNHGDIKELEQRIFENNLDQESILWLREHKFDINFRKNGLLFAQPKELAALARALRLITEELGYSAPKIGFLGPGENGGEYLGRSNLPQPLEKLNPIPDIATIRINSQGDISPLIHELGHHLSNVADNTGSLEAFDKTMDKIERINKAKVKDKKHIEFYTYNPNSRSEQYADFFEYYFLNGAHLRQTIARFETEDPAAANILKAADEFFSETLGGKEYDRGGLTKEDLTPKIPKIEKPVNYQIEQFVKVT